MEFNGQLGNNATNWTSKISRWIFDKIGIHGLGLALEETLQHLGRNAPSYEQFERWILEKKGGSLERDRIERINATISGVDYSEKLKDALKEMEESAPVLKPEDLAFWEENGYVVVHGAVTAENCLTAEQAIGSSSAWTLKTPTLGIGGRNPMASWHNSFTIRH